MPGVPQASPLMTVTRTGVGWTAHTQTPARHRHSATACLAWLLGAQIFALVSPTTLSTLGQQCSSPRHSLVGGRPTTLGLLSITHYNPPFRLLPCLPATSWTLPTLYYPSSVCSEQPTWGLCTQWQTRCLGGMLGMVGLSRHSMGLCSTLIIASCTVAQAHAAHCGHASRSISSTSTSFRQRKTDRPHARCTPSRPRCRPSC